MEIRTFIILLLTVCLFAFSACNGKKTDDASTEKNASQTDITETTNSENNSSTEDYANQSFTLTFKLGSDVLSAKQVKYGETVSFPTPGANKWYVWNETVPDKMPAKNLTFTAVAIGGDAWALTTWEYDFKGTLSIHGKGNMSKFSEESQPWANYKSEITAIVFDSAITGIGAYAFFGCNSLTSVTVPNTVTTIGNYAFANCDSIRELVIGTNVTSIGTGAFVSSFDLECVTFKGNLNWQVQQDNYSTTLSFSAQNKYENASIFKEYCAGKFTAV